MMDVLAGIPTRRRSTAGKIARQLSPFVAKILVVSQKSEVDNPPINSKVVEAPEWGICAPRNFLANAATEGNYDVLLQVDDDVNFPDEVIKTILRIHEEFPNIGAVSSDFRAGAHWNRDLETNQEFRISGVASQLWGVRVQAIKDVVSHFSSEPAFHIDALEDIRFSVKLWTLGWSVVRVHRGESITHSPFVARLSKTNDQGGQYIEERNASMARAIEEMQPFCGKGKVLRFLKLDSKNPDNLRYRIGYDYEVMCENSLRRCGEIGYADSKGRKF